MSESYSGLPGNPNSELSGSVSGRPPDLVIECESPVTLERHGSPVAVSDQRAAKKGRSQEVVSHISMMEVGNKPETTANVGSGRPSTGQVKPSFRDIIVGDTLNGVPRPTVDELEVEVLEEEVLVDNDGLMPKISFSEKFHCSIDQQLTNSGSDRRTLGDIWLLCDGTAVESHLLYFGGSPVPYYGTVVRIDYNTDVASRGRFARLAVTVNLDKPLISGIVIDGQWQPVEYEGLPSICYGCGKYGHSKEVCGQSGQKSVEDRMCGNKELNKEDLYGPWMQVSNRRRKPPVRKDVGAETGNGGIVGRASGSRFSALSQLQEHVIIGEDQHGVDVVTDQTRRVIGSSLARGKTILPPHAESSNARNSDVVELHNANSSPQKQDDGDRHEHTHKEATTILPRNTLSIASSEQVTMVDTSLSKGSHVAVQVGVPRAREQSERILPSSITGFGGSKGHDSGAGVFKKGARTKKRDPRSTSRVSLAGLVENLVSELDTAQPKLVQQSSELSGPIQGTVEAVQWRENTAFDPVGALDPVFNRYFKLYMNLHQPDMFVVIEPRISGSKADAFIRRSRFDSSFRVEAMGFSGGVSASCLMEPTLCIGSGKRETVGYGGDFNAISSCKEREGGSRRRSSISLSFTEFLFDSGLVDMSYNGPIFTWKRGNLSQRLDRGLCNDAWYDLYLNLEVFHLQRLGSDHCPIMIDTTCQRSAGYSRPFRFLSAWNDYSDFQSMLKASWNSDSSMEENIARFQHNSREWNEAVFGHIGRRKCLLLARIKGIERALAQSTSLNLLQLEGDLKNELDSVLEQEEHMWHQKSHSNWIAKGDRNTTFFHTSTMIRRKRNKHVLKKIAALPPPNPALGMDSLSWRWEDNQRFSTRSAYRVLCPRVLENAHSFWRLIWALQVPQRIRVFMWLVMREALLTNVEHTRRHMASSGLCRVCNREDEDVLHALRGCSRPRSVWLSLLPLSVSSMFMSLPLKEWVLANILPHGSCSRGDPGWPIKFVVICWLLWKRRCGLLLDAGFVDRGDLVSYGLKLAAEFTEGMKVAAMPHGLDTVTAPKWTCPKPGWVKVNADGAVDPKEGDAAARGVIRDDEGHWLGGFTRSLGSCTVLMSELWAIHDALSLAWSRGFRWVVLETDNLEASKIVAGSSPILIDNSLVIAIRNLLSYNWEVEVRHIGRAANGVADSLARMLRGAPIGSEMFVEPPMEAAAALLQDLSGLS
ncbi:hypothetical protein GQ457_16G011300 [Hibiscus cannabinus]